MSAVNTPIRIVSRAQVTALQLLGFSGLDPVLVILQDHGEGRGKVVIECYGRAWSAYWGAMGKKSLREFLLSADTDYIANVFAVNSTHRHTKAAYAYLTRIVVALKQALVIDDLAHSPGKTINDIPA